MIKYIKLPLLIRKEDEDAIDWKALGIEKEEEELEWSDEFVDIFSIKGFYAVDVPKEDSTEEETIIRTTVGQVQCRLNESELINIIQNAYNESRKTNDILYSTDRQEYEAKFTKGQQPANLDSSDMD